MSGFYDPYIEKENEYYRTLQAGAPSDAAIKPAVLDEAVDWLCDGSLSILDFGCGSGGLSFPCAFRGVREVLGIDLAEDAIRVANGCAAYVPQCSFVHGSVEKLRELPDNHFDGLILSNILDNMRPEDAVSALEESVRTLKPGGKALIKLNPEITPQQIQAWNIRVIGEDLLDDGLLLWNKNDVYWLALLEHYFSEIRQKDVYFEKHDLHNRLFLCVK